MNFVRKAVATALACAIGAAAIAATPEEVARIGKELTPWGAEIAGNAEGTIPAYAGGLRPRPAGFKADGAGWRRKLEQFTPEAMQASGVR
jgi:hypothetical protein